MSKDIEPIYLDKNGYNEMLGQIEELKEEIKKNDLGRKEAFDAGAGDGWDSPEFEEIERTSFRLSSELKRMYEVLSRVVIVEKQDNEDIVDIGDIVLLGVEFNKGDIEESAYKLTGGSGDLFKEIPEISINSPMGAAIYKKHVGDTCSYTVRDREISVFIKNKMNELEETTTMKR